MQTLVLGAGPAGCAAALHLARLGHDVTLIDRDTHPGAVGSPDDVFDAWDRPAIGQFRQPHNLLGRGRAILRAEFPDVYKALLGCGADEIHQDVFLGDAPREPGDDDLATIACRRPVIDLALRAAVGARPEVHFLAASVAGLRIRAARSAPHVTGVLLESGESVGADLVVDASGRNSAARRWMQQQGVRGWPEWITECHLLYYSRHYRLRAGPLPYASILGGPRGDLGYLGFAVFVGDNSTFCLCVMVPAWEKQWRELRQPAAFERVARHLPGLASWLDAAEPITSILPMGQLRNTLRHTVEHGQPHLTGLIPIGDARCHTNPTFAFGLALGLSHATALGPAIATAANDPEVIMAFEAAIGADATARYEAVSAEDRDRVRLWSGEPIDPTDRLDTMPLFLRSVVYRAATQDAALLRAVCRRINLLDPIDALPANQELLDRGETLFRELPLITPIPRETIYAALRDTAP